MYQDWRHSWEHKNKEFRRYYHKDVWKSWNINQQAHDCCLPQAKKTKTIVKFANRKDLVLKSKKKLKGIKFLGFCSNTDEDWNCVLPSSETDNNSKNVGASEKNLGGKVHMYQSLCPYYRFLYSQVKE